WRNDTETREIFHAHTADGDGPYLRTGDLGAMRDGELFIAGRMKDVLIVRGFKHYPQDIEHTAERQHPAIRLGCSAAFSVDGPEGEAVAIALEIDGRSTPHQDDGDERDAYLAEIIRCVRTAVVDHHGIVLSAVSLLSVGAMPKTSSGKLRRRACRAPVDDGPLDELAPRVSEPRLG